MYIVYMYNRYMKQYYYQNFFKLGFFKKTDKSPGILSPFWVGLLKTAQPLFPFTTELNVRVALVSCCIGDSAAKRKNGPPGLP